MIEHFTDKIFIDWFPENEKYLSPDVIFRLKPVYFSKYSPKNGGSFKLLLYKVDRKYVGFLRYNISEYRCIELEYIAVEPENQRNGIGFELASYAIDEGIKNKCVEVSARYSYAAKRLIETLEIEYKSQVNFEKCVPIEKESE